MAANFFLKFEGGKTVVEGESLDSKHSKELEILTFGFGANQTGSASVGSGLGVSGVNFQDFHFTINPSKATPKLFEACCTGDHFKKVSLVCRKAGGEQQEYMKVTMEDVLVSSYSVGGHNDAGVGPDQVSMNFTKVTFEYSVQKADGTLGDKTIVSYDLKLQKKS